MLRTLARTPTQQKHCRIFLAGAEGRTHLYAGAGASHTRALSLTCTFAPRVPLFQIVCAAAPLMHAKWWPPPHSQYEVLTVQ